MSLEESMAALAESNLKLAKSFDRYADVVEKYGLKIESQNTGKAAASAEDKPEKAEKAEKPLTAAQKKAAAKAKEGDDDGFGEEDKKPEKAKKKLTHDDVKAKLLEIRDAAEDKQPALDIIAEFGYDSIPTIKEKDYDAIFAKAVEWLEENAG